VQVLNFLKGWFKENIVITQRHIPVLFTGGGQNNGNSCERYTFINTELGIHLHVIKLVSFWE